MADRTSTVQRLADSGFQLGPPPETIHHCGHRWGDHVLYAPLDPLSGGTLSCPDCDCTGTWDVPQAEQARKVVRGTPHNHTEHVEGCFRCDLSRDEAQPEARKEDP